MNYLIMIILFIVSFVFMALEIVNAKIVAPYFGDTMYTWSLIISIFLIGSSVGYLIGGKTSDGKHHKRWLNVFFFISILAIAYLPIIENPLYNGLKRMENIHMATLLFSSILFLLPSITLSALVPAVSKIGYEQSLSGTKIGFYHTISAIGSVIGTIVTTFFFLPYLGISYSLFGIIFLLVTVFLIYLGLEIKKYAFYFVVMYGFCLFPLMTVSVEIKNEVIIDKILSSYHTIYITEVQKEEKTIRRMRFSLNDGAIQGQMDMNNKDEIISNYTKQLLKIVHEQEKSLKGKKFYMIGHGIGMITKNIEKEGAEIEVAEIDEKVVEMSRKYFDYTGNSVHVVDGRVFLEKSNKQYDVMILDASNGKKIPKHLITKEYFELTKEKLNENGFVIMNYLGSIEDGKLNSIYHTFENVYSNVVLLKMKGREDKEVQNLFIVAKEGENSKIPDGLEIIENVERGKLLTDDKN